MCGSKLSYGWEIHNLGGAGGLKRTSRKLTHIRVNFFRNFRFKFDIAWCVSWSLVQKEVLSPLHRYVAVLILGTNIQFCLSIT